MTEKMDGDKEPNNEQQDGDATVGKNHLDPAFELNSIAVQLSERFEREGEIKDLNDAIDNTRRAVNLAPQHHPKQAILLQELSLRLNCRYDRTGNLDDLKEAISNAQRAVEVKSQDNQSLIRGFNTLAICISSRYKENGSMDDLEEAERNDKKALELTAEDDPNLRLILQNLAVQLWQNYHRTGNRDKSEEAIQYAQRAVDLGYENVPDFPIRLNTLASQLADRYERTGNMNDLEEAITNVRKIISNTLQEHPNFASWLKNLGSHLWTKYNRTGNLEELDEAIQHTQRAVTITPQGHPELGLHLNNLSVQLNDRYIRTGNTDDLEEAIKNSQRAVDIPTQNSMNLALFLSTMSARLWTRYKRRRDRDDLEAGIVNIDRAIGLTPQGHPSLALRLNSLAIQLAEQYERSGNTYSLEEAIKNSKTAINTTDPNDPSLWYYLSNLAGWLWYRYRRIANEGDLDEAIINIKKAIKLIPPSNPQLASLLINFSDILLSRYRLKQNKDDLKRAIRKSQSALTLTPQDHTDYPSRLHSLALLTLESYRRTRRLKDLEEALQNAQNATTCPSHDDENRVLSLQTLGSILIEKYNISHDNSYRDTALGYYLEAFDRSNVSPLQRLKAARGAIKILVKKDCFPEASSLADKAVDLLPVLCNRNLSRQDLQHAVAQASGLAAEACSLWLETGHDRDQAVKYLEYSRTLIIGYIIDGRGDISDLRKVAPEKADEFETLRDKAFRPIDSARSLDDRRLQLRERQKAANDMEQCLKGIRQFVPGYDKFLLPPAPADLIQHASDGPIVFVNVTSIRSDALILQETGVTPIHLPDLNVAILKKPYSGGLMRSPRDTAPASEGHTSKQFRRFLRHLWSSCVYLVLEKLGFLKPVGNKELPRIWWIGTGLASSLPFHAAEYHSQDSVESTLNYAISSYTPSVKALRYARERAMARPINPSVLLVSMSKTPGFRDLPGVREEKRKIRAIVKDPYLMHPPLIQPNAETVLKRLPSCNIVHFACHGSSDLTNPSDSFLALHGKFESSPDRLTVQNISDLHLENAWLAFLSACSTAQNKVSDLEDEVLHLASGFQMAGYPHVIASMWPSDDKICVQIATIFYREIIRNEGTCDSNRVVATALHTAIKEVRSQAIAQPILWSQYIHTGA